MKNYTIQTQKISLVQESTGIEQAALMNSKETANMIKILCRNAKIDMSYTENFVIIGLDTRLFVKVFAHISQGGCTSTIVDVRVIFSHLLLSGCTRFVVAHNHPSGNASPSQSDRDVTKKLLEAGKLLDITLIDHIILTENEGYYSFANDMALYN